MNHVFYSPHTDDETIGMGGAIADAVYAGHRVSLVLVTQNLPSTRGRDIFKSFSVEELVSERLREFEAAACVYGVRDVVRWEVSESEDRSVLVEIIGRLMATWESPETVHHTTAPFDYTPEGTTHRSHNACAEAALTVAPRERVCLHGVYAYYHDAPAPAAAWVERPLSVAQLARKREALRCYQPGRGMLGYGYTSVAELIDAAAARTVEYDYVGQPSS